MRLEIRWSSFEREFNVPNILTSIRLKNDQLTLFIIKFIEDFHNFMIKGLKKYCSSYPITFILSDHPYFIYFIGFIRLTKLIFIFKLAQALWQAQRKELILFKF